MSSKGSFCVPIASNVTSITAYRRGYSRACRHHICQKMSHLHWLDSCVLWSISVSKIQLWLVYWLPDWFWSLKNTTNWVNRDKNRGKKTSWLNLVSFREGDQWMRLALDWVLFLRQLCSAVAITVRTMAMLPPVPAHHTKCSQRSSQWPGAPGNVAIMSPPVAPIKCRAQHFRVLLPNTGPTLPTEQITQGFRAEPVSCD